MIERFDVEAKSKNPVYAMFASEHIRRYQIAAEFISTFNLARRTIIDAASGCGYGSELLGKLGHYVGLDCSLEAIRGARAVYPQADFRMEDIEHRHAFTKLLPGAVVSLETAEHLHDPRTFLQSIRRSLLTCSPFVFSAPTSLTMDFDPFHLRDWSYTRWGNELQQAGFLINSITSMPLVGKFTDFLRMIPTTLRQKWRVFWYNACHRRYAHDRIKNWICHNRFEWTSTLFCCRAA